jgi:hypothetical protein
MAEKRKHPRLDYCLPITLSDSQWDIATETKNISCSGAYCAVDKPIKIMTKLDIALFVPCETKRDKKIKKINCKGVIVRCEHNKQNQKRPYYVGIYFNEIDKAGKKLLFSHIHSCLDSQAPA